MIDTQYLKHLLPILKTHGVKHIKMQGLELLFHAEQSAAHLSPEHPYQEPNNLHAHQEHQPDSTQIIAETVRKQEEALPPDLRADALMDQDKILNWSSPDQSPNELELPLTGEQPL